ncbi:uncharacterized protein E5676_scaffold248G002980 [Cucumis melo var. makuwa]|uniref:Uncharacterized protein n=1 Tax=Cucumis melo var. makuwa TaxID=1194695 RepID=A0A5D3BJ40_CUCMM|nr:uncharacterized protein E5676_scaffold248G002980 [Cucumis melo var. makuwa]
MEDDNPNPVIQTRRSSIKTHPRYNNQQSWKQKLRENCCKRVREGRSRLLWKMRLPMSSPTYPHSLNNRQQDFIKSAFQDIFSDELKKIKDESVNDFNENLPSVPEAADVLWEYEGIHDAYEGDGEEILLEMQRIFYEDLNVDMRQKGDFADAVYFLKFIISKFVYSVAVFQGLNAFKNAILSRMFTQFFAESEGPIVTWEDEEDEFLARAVYEHMQLSNEKILEKFWCPMCKQGELQENSHFIHCTQCGLRLNKGNEVTLDLLRCRLADVHAEHLDRGCRLKPKFCVESRFNITALYISCEGCNTFEVKTQPLATFIGVNATVRRQWISTMLEDIDKKNILAVQTLRNMIMGSSLMATTSILLCAGLAAVLSSTYSIKKPVYESSQPSNECPIAALVCANREPFGGDFGQRSSNNHGKIKMNEIV